MDSKNNNITEPRCNYYDRLWKVSRQDVLNFIGDPANPKPNMANATSDIKDWPGNGNILFNEDLFLAPFYDANSDLTYNPKDGDYPYYYFESSYPGNVCNDYLFGDQSVWWVMNDVGNVHTLTQAQPIGLEIQAQAFAFETDDEINNMTFYKYKIINRSSNNLNQTYFSVWVDPDLGYATDDYVGCDKTRFRFCYNGDDNDDGISGYGASPPALGVDFFQGPLADLNDGIDNDKDGTIDEPGEQIIMSKFLYYNNNNNGINGEPSSPNEYYNYMRGIWLDGSALTCDGKAGTDPNFPQTDYMFPGSSNTFNTGCGTNWTEATAGNTPEDRRFYKAQGLYIIAGEIIFLQG
ncbi:MAG: hypothetical protein IPP29_09085 [Bacteroidetes bacterium]|nr:hypothetical protein [Bacteroidota bacterium]